MALSAILSLYRPAYLACAAWYRPGRTLYALPKTPILLSPDDGRAKKSGKAALYCSLRHSVPVAFCMLPVGAGCSRQLFVPASFLPFAYHAMPFLALRPFIAPL